MRSFLRSRLAPFQSLPFRQFFFVQSVSLTGLWAFDAARSWIIVDGLGRAEAIGLVLMAGAIPPLLLSLYAGVLVDRLDLRQVVIRTKAGLAILSLALAFLVEYHQIELWHLVVFSFFQGTVNAFDGPTFHAVTVRLVQRQDFQQAIALNSSNFHLSRAFGPAIAGFLMAIHGPALVFLFDALSYAALILVLRKVKLRQPSAISSTAQRPRSSARDDWQALKEGLSYFFREPVLRYQLLQLFTALGLLFPLLLTALRAYVKQRYSLENDEFAYILSLAGVGSAIGAISFALYVPKVPVRGLLIGIPLGVISVSAMPLAKEAWMAGWIMTLIGFSLFLCFASLTVSLNLEVEEKYRGRLGSLLTLGFFSLGPLLSYPVGAIADRVGYETSFVGFGALFGLVSLLLFGLSRRRAIDK